MYVDLGEVNCPSCYANDSLVWGGEGPKMESVLRKFNPETGLFDYKDVIEFIGPGGDPQAFKEHDGWEFCCDDIWDVQKMGDGYMVILYEFDEDSTGDTVTNHLKWDWAGPLLRGLIDETAICRCHQNDPSIVQ